ncbi:hypothetical protein AII11_01700 [Salmonella enterica]|nr:hypothetical protein [Salmonella enterica]EBP8152584.1 hypothetical protein [Salmonella enterica]
MVGLAIDQIAQSGLSSLSVIYYSAQLFSQQNTLTSSSLSRHAPDPTTVLLFLLLTHTGEIR